MQNWRVKCADASDIYVCQLRLLMQQAANVGRLDVHSPSTTAFNVEAAFSAGPFMIYYVRFLVRRT